MEDFIAEMARLGLSPREEAGLVICEIIPVTGPRAGTTVEVGVAADELERWPDEPPHWVHMPADIGFPYRSGPSPKEGWAKHSRNNAGWGDAPAAACWTAHLQAVLAEATG
ncbi:MAG: hypothetical protein OXI32_03310 [bacterium]|nr:hypothetical protein [bacterium]